jgi:biopolymer transport protein TolQ
MNILRIFLESSLAAQIIMSILIIFSIWSWAIFFKKILSFSRVRSEGRRFLTAYRFQKDLKALEDLGSGPADSAYARILKSGLEEFKKLESTKGLEANVSVPQKPDRDMIDGLSDNIRLAMERTKITEIQNLESNLPVLGTFVSVSPFLGLLGTVWGIMEAFLDIRTRGSAHITIVAPGISDALITTVYGLLVAIPALFFFNIFRSRVNTFDTELDKFISEVFARLRKELANIH